MPQSIVRRYEGNPILTPADVPYPVETVHNAGMARYNGKYMMLFRSHRATGRSILGLAESDDGYHFKVRPEPFMLPVGQQLGPDARTLGGQQGGAAPDAARAGKPPVAQASAQASAQPSAQAQMEMFAEYEEYGIEDARICHIDDRYLITYSAYSRHGVRIGLAATRDFQAVERISLISQADMRNVVIFPERFDGRYARLDRPHSEISRWAIWISYSPDLVHWGDSRVVMKPVTYHWDEMKIGPGATPIRTDRGWLHIYHGVFPTMDGSVYRLGVALHDLHDPGRIIGVCDRWILQPEHETELVGYVHNVVFTCGAIPENDGTLKLYWGGADKVMHVGVARIDELVDLCLNESRPPY